MTPATPRDPFTGVGVDHRLDLDARALEKRYLELSRQCHPDLHRAADTSDCIAVLQRAAEVNDAWRILKDPWARARALIERRDPQALAQSQKLDPAFLLQAMEDAEAASTCPPAAVPALRQRLQQEANHLLQSIRAALDAGDAKAAATAFHQSKYHRKALADLEARS